MSVAAAKQKVEDSKQAVVAAEATAKAAKKTYKADKSNKDNKKAMKAAKAAIETAKEAVTAAEAALKKAEADAAAASKKRKATDDAQGSSKKAKLDVAGATAAVKAAKKTYKADKTKENKKALKAAKAALVAAEEAAKADSSSDSSSDSDSDSDDEEEAKEEEKKEEETKEDEPMAAAPAAGNVAKADNPTNCPKIFCGNLSFDIDEDTMREFLKDCGTITDLHWLEDRDTGRFKGCGFITFDSPDGAAAAVAKNGEMLMGRDIKVDYSQPKERKSKGASKFANKPLSEKPEGCLTVFCGNLSFDIDEDGMRDFAADCGEINKIRWLTDRDSGDFKGCGFVEFWDTESVDKFVKKNGQDLMGRAIRLDYAAARKPRD